MRTLILELVSFAREHKKLWILPLVLVLVLVGALLLYAQTSALAPFIYTLF